MEQETEQKMLVKTTVGTVDSNNNIEIKINDSIEIKINHNKLFQTLANRQVVCNSLGPELEKLLEATLKSCSKKWDFLK